MAHTCFKFLLSIWMEHTGYKFTSNILTKAHFYMLQLYYPNFFLNDSCNKFPHNILNDAYLLQFYLQYFEWSIPTCYNFHPNILNGAYILVTTFLPIFWMEQTYLLQLSSQYFEWSIHTCYNFPPNFLNGAYVMARYRLSFIL